MRPEEKARRDIDKLFLKADWAIQDVDQINLGASLGVAVREYGLGLEVIYTCRLDWAKEELLKDNDGEVVNFLYDNSGKEIKIKKEGVLFDLSHRNRIEWTEDNLLYFKTKLENRIKALIC